MPMVPVPASSASPMLPCNAMIRPAAVYVRLPSLPSSALRRVTHAGRIIIITIIITIITITIIITIIICDRRGAVLGTGGGRVSAFREAGTVGAVVLTAAAAAAAA
eukprot:GHVU01086860.1.p2 GENE.GHVU01086860.1~~GHVU01086860.1.p2  ORF type:complete len:106 (+),score=28.96 GHVU01086860.1:350-667(+)